MNTLWIYKMSEYRHSEKALLSSQVIIDTKIKRSAVLLKHFGKNLRFSFEDQDSIEHLLLYEARAAKAYWKLFGQIVPDWTDFPGRVPRGQDVTNTLLDIGYHHINSKLTAVLTKHDIMAALALLHTPHTSDAKPLVYDLMELFRADVVDMTVLTWLRQKKRPIAKVTQKHIAHFVHNLNERLEKKYYLRTFKQCHTYEYYMELQVLKFISAINHRKVFKPMHLPSRHDVRCTCKKCKV